MFGSLWVLRAFGGVGALARLPQGARSISSGVYIDLHGFWFGFRDSPLG